MAPTPFERAVAAIEDANAQDPNLVDTGGERIPKELLHGRLAAAWVERLRPGASDALRLAAYAHHVRRWELPRSRYPAGRAGYLHWRRDQYRRHAELAAGLVRGAGVDEATVARVARIVAKRDLASDPEVQTLEDALCLVFLETGYEDLLARTDRDKMVEILRKTLAKMSPAGVAAARAVVARLGDEARSVLDAAATNAG